MLARPRLQKPLMGRSLPSSHAPRGILVVAALALAAGAAAFTSSARAAGPLSQIGHIVVIYEENHSFDNSTAAGKGVERAAAAPTRRTRPGRPGRHALRLPARRTTSTSPRPPLPSMCTDSTTGTAFTSHVRQRSRSPSTSTSRPATRPVRRPARFARTECLNGRRACPAAARATSCTGTTRSSTRSTAASRTATSPAATPPA